MGAHDGTIEHLDQMRRRRQCGKMIEECLEHTGLAQPVEAFPDALPFAEPLRQHPPGDIVDREIVHGFQKQPVVTALIILARQRGLEHLQHHRLILLLHVRGHCRFSMNQTKCISGIRYNPHAAIRSHGLVLGNVQR